MKKTDTKFKCSIFLLEDEQEFETGKRALWMTYGSPICNRVAYSKASARRLAKQLREAADWVERVWK